ncbi:acetyltransferase [Ralstonia mojiangensis]|uniref:acetyltransferase n=1 Tax=Ralstonia mojiangensis TaxID=2953895 RepID=UPI0021B418F2|nr:acetyltransferase [Ralstonia mojiangensis]MCT7327664.1 acetyltransferase [Ralstonia mojiangensis]
MKRLLIVGAGGHGRSVAEAACAAGQYAVAGFIDDVTEVRQVWAWPVVGRTSDLAKYGDLADAAIVAIGKNGLREKLCEQLLAANFELATIVHPKAVVSPSSVIGAGSAIMAGAIVGTEAQLGVGAIVNCGAVVDHHCRVENFGHLGVNAAMAGGSTLGYGAWMQAGSVLGYGVKVAAWAVLEPGQALQSK